MKYLLFTFILLSISISASGQEIEKSIGGKVTFTTSDHVYVRFGSTKKIELGDTLQLSDSHPCLIVEKKSSSSCICKRIGDCNPVKGNDVLFIDRLVGEGKEKTIPFEDINIVPLELEENEVSIEKQTTGKETNVEKKSDALKERIFGRASVSSYSSFLPNELDDNHRIMTRFSANYNNINESNFSLETYLNYRQNFRQDTTPSFRPDKIFRIYNAALKYEIDSVVTLVLGRKINSKISSIGAIDGFQVEKFFKSNYVGAIIGFRPDIFDFGFNPDLLEYGGYVGKALNGTKFNLLATLGILEQRNKGQVDRRYTYMQQSLRLGRNLNLFSSIEVDLYSKVLDKVDNSPRLTNLFISARYRVNRKISLSGSYDARNRIIFFETLKTDVERLLDDELRQGIRARINIKPFKYITAGASYSLRFQNSDQNQSKNINGFLSLSKIPMVSGRIYLNCNFNTSSYARSEVYSVRYSRNIIKKWLDGDFYYRKVNYLYTNSEFRSSQQFVGTNLSLRLMKTFTFNVLGEVTFRETEKTYRMNAKIIKRFGSKRRR